MNEKGFISSWTANVDDSSGHKWLFFHRRLSANREGTACARQQATPEQREARLSANREGMARARQQESLEQRQARLERRQQSTNPSRPTQQRWKKAALNYSSATNYNCHHDVLIGAMSHECQYCHALKWNGEAPGMCCSNGRVKLLPLVETPEPLKSLLLGDSTDSKQFLLNIRKYNSAFQMTSFGCTEEVCLPGFMPTFKVQGQVYHRIGAMLPQPGEEPQFLQIYFMGDTQEQAERRCSAIPGVKLHIIRPLQEMLHSTNSYVTSFKTALEKMDLPEHRIVIHPDKAPATEHQRRFNAPATNEVAILIVGQEFNKRDIVLQKRNNHLQRVAETHRSYDALQYPLLFCHGEDGYNFELRQLNPTTGQAMSKKVSAMDFYAYRMMVRTQDFNRLIRTKTLFHQFLVDMYAKIEAERLKYIHHNQSKLRVDNYIHLRDAVAQDVNAAELGQAVILPSSFTGGPQYMHERTQDAMTYVRKYGQPDLFITFTCNPSWPEIKDELMESQTSQDRHDLLARVFHLKLKKLMDLLIRGAIFDTTRCYMYSIEWQKRGLPHSHILVWLHEKLRPTQVDSFISAEIPNPEEDPVLYDIVKKHMIHGPCGALNRSSPCMHDGKCTKRYPRDLLQQTQTGADGYPLYRRRKPGDGGFTAKVRIAGRKEVEIDNKWVVPYCPLLSKIFNAHINVEYCNSVKSIKYICKYINKGSDQAVFGVERQGVEDEVARYQTGRYICTSEAVWRILDFPIHQRYPPVEHLSVHLENGQRVYFTEDNVRERVSEPPKTTLTSFFELCQQDNFAKTLLYCDIPKYYRWDKASKKWKRRIQGTPVEEQPGIKSCDTLGRVYTVHPCNLECFCLRLLLHVVKGPTSFAALRIVDQHQCATFREACFMRGLLEDDAHWNATLEEAAVSHSPHMLRSLFGIMIVTCGLGNPRHLWDTHKESLAEDILLQVRRLNPDQDVHFNEAIFNEALILLEEKVIGLGGQELKFYGLPTPQRHQRQHMSREMLRETSYDQEELAEYVSRNEPRLVQDQAAAYEIILEKVQSASGGITFLDAPGGTGKTFLINLLLAKVRQQGKIAVAVASSGIAATLLTGGRTAHSAFKLPLNLAHTETPTCNISNGTDTANVLKECQLIVWDECTMANKLALEALDRTLRDIRENQSLLGGVTLLLAGDFRQTLPVIPKGTPADELSACLKSSYLWHHVHTLTLSNNMRVHLQGDTIAGEFASLLLAVGNGQLPVNKEGMVTIPPGCGKVVDNAAALNTKVYPNLALNYKNHKWLCERSILAPRNDMVNTTNDQLLQLWPGEERVYKSLDTVVEMSEVVQYPTEFLNSLQPPGMPPHILKLKVGCPIMLLRNLDAPKLCNGTRLIIKQMMPHVLEATLLTGQGKGEDVFIPRIPLIPSDVPFQFKRLQFPVRVSFAMSINKSQGQSLQVVGLNLENPCFSHGQLYVGCSRVGRPDSLYIYAHQGQTKNIVYARALQ